MTKTYQLIDQRIVGEQGVDAPPFATITHERDLVTGDVITNVADFPDEMFGIVHCFVSVVKPEVRLVVAPVKFGRVSNIATPGGKPQIVS